MSLLLVEDDLPLGGALQKVLAAAGHPTVWVRAGEPAQERLQSDTFELLLLDVVLPGMSGLDVLRWLRDRGDATPVMLLTTRDAVADRVAGLDGGADDYLGKPFAVAELLSRVRALSRRRVYQLRALWTLGPLEIDTARRSVRVAGSACALQPREFDVLLALAANAGRVMTRRQLESAVSLSPSAESNALDVTVCALRKKLGVDLIATVRGVGYVIDAPLARAP